MSDICCNEQNERKPEASIDLGKGVKFNTLDIGKEVSVTIKGKLAYVSMGKNWSGDDDSAIQGHMRVEISSLKVEGSNVFSELAEDD